MTLGKKIGFVLLALLLTSVTVVENAHGHFVGYDGTRSHEELQSHDCGPIEHHKPLGSDFTCILCQRVAQFVSTVGNPTPITVVESRQIFVVHPVLPFSYQTWSDCYMRGPPTSAVSA